MQRILDLEARTSSRLSFFLCRAQCLVKFYLTKPVFRLGEDIVGWFDFGEAGGAACFQVAVLLESEEILFHTGRNKADESSAQTQDTTKPAGSTVSHAVHGRRQEFTTSMVVASLMLPIPLTCTPSFRTDLGGCLLFWTTQITCQREERLGARKSI